MKTIKSKISKNCLNSWNQSQIIKTYTEILLIAMVQCQGLSNSSSKKQLVGIALCRSCLDWRIFFTREAAENMTILMILGFWVRLSGCLGIVSRPTKNETLCCLARVEQATVCFSPSWCRIFSKTESLTTVW